MRQPDVETWLDSIETAWSYVDELDLAAVDEKASLRNQARLEPLDDDTVERYAADMTRGDVFPPVIVRSKNSRLVVLGGNHRYHAAKRSRPSSMSVWGSLRRRVLVTRAALATTDSRPWPGG